jgi:hypothetical protein
MNDRELRLIMTVPRRQFGVGSPLATNLSQNPLEMFERPLALAMKVYGFSKSKGPIAGPGRA